MSIKSCVALFLGLAAAMPFAQVSNSTTSSSNSTSSNSTVHSQTKLAQASSSWWFPNIDYSNSDWANYAPNLGNDYSYQVYVPVSNANDLINAISSGGPNGGRDNGYLAAEPRVIYIAPGTYTLTSTLYLYTDTILIGDASNPPTIKASSNFNGNQLIAGGVDQNGDGQGELKFSTMIKNVILDTTALSGTSDFTALSWRVAQNSGTVNVVINMPSGVHTGMTMGQGSTIQVGDVTFNYGNIGLAYNGAQQATLKNMVFNKCTTGIQVNSGNTLNIFHPSFNTNGFPIVLGNNVGTWVSVVDANVVNSGTFFTSNTQYPNFMLENIVVDSSKNDVVVVYGTTKVSGRTKTGSYVYGNTVGANPIYQTNNAVGSLSRPSALTTGSNGFYPVFTANQYPNAKVGDVINLKNPNQNGGYTIKGDDNTNDGPNLQSALNYAAKNGKIAFLPFGVYRTRSTITIPPGTELVGNGWSTIQGYGSTFSDASNPKPVVQVGAPGSTGTAHIQDIRFTVGQVLPGAIVVQVNMAGSKAGDVAISNSLITVGGTPDSEVNCNDLSSCKAAYIGLHLTSSSSAYIDNVWAWVADHSTDGLGAGTSIAAKGGVLIEATKGTWLAGLGSEHFWLYNLNFNAAANVFLSFFQAETNYQQGQDDNGNQKQPRPASPWSTTSSDPDFSWCSGKHPTCYKTIAQFFSNNKSSNIHQYGAGSWNFDFYGGNQAYMNVFQTIPSSSNFYGLTAHCTLEVGRLPDGTTFGDPNNYGGSWGNLVAAYTT